MGVVTTPMVTVSISQDVAQLLWLAMHQDDDLASDYAELAISHAIGHLIREISPTAYSPAEYYRLVVDHEVLCDRLCAQNKEMAERYAAYEDPPF